MSGDIEDLKSSVSNGKTSIASAITDKGISTSSTDTFSKMAENIRSIPSGSNITLKAFNLCTPSTPITLFYADSNKKYIIFSSVYSADDNYAKVGMYSITAAVSNLTIIESRTNKHGTGRGLSITITITDNIVVLTPSSGSVAQTSCVYGYYEL